MYNFFALIVGMVSIGMFLWVCFMFVLLLMTEQTAYNKEQEENDAKE